MSPHPGSGRWSYQTGFQQYGINLRYSQSVRWGFIWNNERDTRSVDVLGGLGMTRTGYSAGDYYGCCGRAGANRSFKFLLYARNSA